MRPPRVVGEPHQGNERTDRRPASSLADIIERDDRKLRSNTRHTNFTPEYQAWLKRQRRKKQGRNP